jgi:hypothetical protein
MDSNNPHLRRIDPNGGGQCHSAFSEERICIRPNRTNDGTRTIKQSRTLKSVGKASFIGCCGRLKNKKIGYLKS